MVQNLEAMKNQVHTKSAFMNFQRVSFNAPFLFCLLLGVLFISSPASAQRRSVKPSGTQAAPAPGTVNDPGLAKPNVSLGSINKSDANTTTNPNISQSITSGDQVFYIKTSAGDANSSGSSVYMYNTATKTTEDIIRSNSQAAEYNEKAVVENIVLDKASNKLYFSASLANRRGFAEYVTWRYDITKKQLMAYKDGKIESIDPSGNQTIVFESINANGKFTNKWIVAPDGRTLQSVVTKNEKNVN
jgi:hypothetical protein